MRITYLHVICLAQAQVPYQIVNRRALDRVCVAVVNVCRQYWKGTNIRFDSFCDHYEKKHCAVGENWRFV